MSKYQIKMMSGDKYFITEEEFKNLSKLKEKSLLFIPSIGGLINIASVETIIGEDKIDMSNVNERTLSTGVRVVRKFNDWYIAGTETKIDLKYFPELTKDKDIKQLT